MNKLKACEILELPDNYSEDILKKKYKSLAMKYHPDKNKTGLATNEKFTEMSAAYEFLSKNTNQPANINVDNLFNNIFKTFTTNFQFQPMKPHKQQTVNINLVFTAKEYIAGTTRSLSVKSQCNCERKICMECAGCGFSIPGVQFKPCMNCLGEGTIQSCENCENGINFQNKNVTFSPYPENEIFHENIGLIKISIEEPYFVKDKKVHCYFDISLKESLTGFHKIFKDPFDITHNIIVNDIVLKTNDGYQTPCGIVLVFNVIYPRKLNHAVIEQLKQIDF